MIYLVTNSEKTYKRSKDKIEDIIVLKDNNETFNLYKDFVNKQYIEDKLELGFDTETNGLDAYKNELVLEQIGNAYITFVFHSYYCNTKKYIQYIKDKGFTILGANLKFDLKFLMSKHNIHWDQNLYDVMIAEQRLTMKSGKSAALASIMERYFNKIPDAMDKTIRNEFIGCSPKDFKLQERHIRYAASDINYLFNIKERQKVTINAYRMNFLLYKIFRFLNYVL